MSKKYNTYCFTIKIVGKGVNEEAAWEDALEATKTITGGMEYESAENLDAKPKRGANRLWKMSIDEYNNEQEYSHPCYIAASTEKKALKEARNLARSLYSNSQPEIGEENSWFVHWGPSWSWDGTVTEVTGIREYVYGLGWIEAKVDNKVLQGKQEVSE